MLFLAHDILSLRLQGLINNVLYVIILSAALDLVGPNVPKGVVLLADVIPSFLMKLCAPYFIHVMPYSIRIFLLVVLSTLGMLLVALTPAYTDGGTVSTKMAGVVLASLSSGAGELSFLGLTHFYGPFSLAGWGSGTGAAGLLGAGAYAIATTALKMSVKTALLASSCLPVIMLISFFVILPRGVLRQSGYSTLKTEVLHDLPEAPLDDQEEEDREGHSVIEREDEGLLTPKSAGLMESRASNTWLPTFQTNLKRARKLFFPL